jgi:hypothetical protein
MYPAVSGEKFSPKKTLGIRHEEKWYEALSSCCGY